jgi:hypothetical protein
MMSNRKVRGIRIFLPSENGDFIGFREFRAEGLAVYFGTSIIVGWVTVYDLEDVHSKLINTTNYFL